MAPITRSQTKVKVVCPTRRVILTSADPFVRQSSICYVPGFSFLDLPPLSINPKGLFDYDDEHQEDNSYSRKPGMLLQSLSLMPPYIVFSSALGSTPKEPVSQPIKSLSINLDI